MAASKNPQLRLLHIRDEIDGMASALQGVTFAAYRESYTLRRAAERAVQIVSEAVKSLPSELLASHPVCLGVQSSVSATSCGMNISTLTIAAYGRF
jgi:uncharacterized protein with HEPN domain